MAKLDRDDDEAAAGDKGKGKGKAVDEDDDEEEEGKDDEEEEEEESDEDSSEDDDEDETAELLRELEKIKRERAEEKERIVSATASACVGLPGSLEYTWMSSKLNDSFVY